MVRQEKKTGRWRRVGWAALGGLLVLGALAHPATLRWTLARVLPGWLSREYGLELEFTELAGNPYRSLRLEGVELKGTDDIDLSVEGGRLELSYDLGSLVRGGLDGLHSLTVEAERIRFVVPESSTQGEEDPPTSDAFDLPNELPALDLRVDRLEVVKGTSELAVGNLILALESELEGCPLQVTADSEGTHLQGQWSREGEAWRGDLEIESPRIDELAGRFGFPVASPEGWAGFTDVGSGHARARGTWVPRDWQRSELEFESTVEGVNWEEVDGAAIGLRGSLGPGGITIGAARLEVGERSIAVTEGWHPWPDSSETWSTAWRRSRCEVRWNLQGLDATVERLLGLGYEGPFVSSGRLSARGDRWEIGPGSVVRGLDAVRWKEGKLQWSGTDPMPSLELDTEVEISTLGPWLEPFLDDPPSASISGTVSTRGPILEPTLGFDLSSVDWTLGDRKLAALEAEGRYTHPVLELDRLVARDPRGGLQARGSWDIGRGTLANVVAELRVNELSDWAPPRLRGGPLDARVEWSGAYDQLRGPLHLDARGILFDNEPIDTLLLDAELSPGRLELARLNVEGPRVHADAAGAFIYDLGREDFGLSLETLALGDGDETLALVEPLELRFSNGAWESTPCRLRGEIGGATVSLGSNDSGLALRVDLEDFDPGPWLRILAPDFDRLAPLGPLALGGWVEFEPGQDTLDLRADLSTDSFGRVASELSIDGGGTRFEFELLDFDATPAFAVVPMDPALRKKLESTDLTGWSGRIEGAWGDGLRALDVQLAASPIGPASVVYALEGGAPTCSIQPPLRVSGERLEPWLPAGWSVENLRVGGRFSNPEGGPNGTLRLDLANPRWNGEVVAEGIEVRMEAVEGGIEFAGTRILVAGDSRVELFGYVPLSFGARPWETEGSIDLHGRALLSDSEVDFARFLSTSAGAKTSPLTRLEADLSIRGPWRQSEGSVDLVAESSETWLQERSWSLPAVDGTPRTAVLTTSLSWGPELFLRSDHPADSPKEGVRIDALQVDLESLGGLAGSARWEVPVDLADWCEAAATGVLPSGWGTGDVAGELSVDVAALEGLGPIHRSIRRLEGRLRAEASLAGTVLDPIFSGRVDANSVAFRYDTLPAASEVNLALELETTGLRIETARGELGGAPWSLEGGLDWSGGDVASELSLRGSNVLLVRDDGVQVRADLDLSLEGQGGVRTLRGEVALTDGRYGKTVNLLESLRRSFDGGPTLPRTTRGLDFGIASSGPLADLQLDLRVVSVEPFRLRNNVLSGGVRPDLQVKGTGAVPLLEGPIYLEPTRLSLPSGALRIESGTVYFDRSDPFVPRVALQAQALRLGYDLRARVEGPYDRPEIYLSSEPPLPDDDLLVLMVTGQLPDSTLSTRSEDAARALAVYLVQDALGRWLSDGSGVDPDSLASRLEIQIGNEVTRNGVTTTWASFRIGDEVKDIGSTQYLVGERDVYDHINFGYRFLFRFE